MAVDRWFIGGGAEHTPESARRLVHASTGGAEGVGGIHDLKVLPLAVPGQGVRVVVGSALIRSHYIGGETQTYMGTVYEQETVSITPTGSGSGRSDLVVLRVEDPFAAGSTYSPPTGGDIATAPYVHVRVISGVPAGTKRLQDVPGHQNDSAVTLARIDFPASTGTVTAGIIKDLRVIAQPRSKTTIRTYALVTGDGSVQITSTTAYPAGGQTWPVAVEDAWGELEIPEWATRMRIQMTWGGVRIPPGNSWGHTWVQVAPTVHPNNTKTQSTAWDTPGLTQATKYTHVMADDIAVPAGLRGTAQKFYPRANRTGGAANGGMILDSGSSLALTVEFYEEAV